MLPYALPDRFGGVAKSNIALHFTRWPWTRGELCLTIILFSTNSLRRCKKNYPSLLQAATVEVTGGHRLTYTSAVEYDHVVT